MRTSALPALLVLAVGACTNADTFAEERAYARPSSPSEQCDSRGYPLSSCADRIRFCPDGELTVARYDFGSTGTYSLVDGGFVVEAGPEWFAQLTGIFDGNTLVTSPLDNQPGPLVFERITDDIEFGPGCH